MRRIISFIIALFLAASGAVAMLYLLLVAPSWRGWMIMAAGLMFTAGAMWLYADYIDATPNHER